jgi:Carboxypeptidase regulatory-like domain
MVGMGGSRSEVVMAAVKAISTSGLRLFFSIILAAAIGPTGWTQANAAGGLTGNLRGTIIDAQTQSPVVGAHVVAVAGSSSFRTQTDTHGFFSLLQLPTDTYSVSVTKDGYVPQVIAGVTILGDETQSVGIVKLLASPKSLGSVRVSGRSPASAFQPTQTTDETTFVGARVDQALGERGSTDYTQLVRSAPGVIPTENGSLNPISIRGSASVEIGYQFDGIDFSGNFFDENGDDSYLNGVGGGRGALQVVSGAGDATQGGIGAGVVNVIPGRGSYPGDGFTSFDVSGPWYDHSFAFEYGTATKDNRFSDFLSTRSSREAPQIAPYGRDASDAGQYLGTSFSYDDDVMNNFFYKFGRNDNQEFQVLTRWMDHRSWAEYGGLGFVNYYPYDPFSYQQFETDPNGASMWDCAPGLCGNSASGNDPGLGWYQSIIPYYPGVPTTYAKVTQPEEYIYGPENVLKLGYTWNINPTTSWNTFFYNWGGLFPNNITGDSQFLTTGQFFSGYNNVGGRRVGFQSQIVKQLGDKHTLTMVGKFENGFPYWNQMYYSNTWVGLYTGRLQDESNMATAGYPADALPNAPRIEDWYLPENTSQQVSQSNPCIGPTIYNGFSQNAATPLGTGCYLYYWLFAHGLWKGHLPTVPSTGFTYGSTDFQQYGIGIRDQWNPNAKLLVDWGLRLDGQNLRWGPNQFSKDLSDPSDVGLGYAQLGNDYLRPQVVEPRVAANYILNSNNSVRASYGRSISFFFAQTAGTPTGAAYVNPLLYDIPAKDTLPNNSPFYSPLGPACGSGWHGPGTNANGKYYQSPWVYFSGEGTLGIPGYYFFCPNYAESVYWLFDQAFAAPDVGGSGPPTYNNWDVAWTHQFANGWGSKLTGYWRRGYDTYQVTLLNAGPPDPATGQQTAGSFAVRETGVQKAFGIESMITTPTPRNGWSGFLTMNYINELTNTPPVAGSDSLPVVSQYLYETGVLFHQYYLPPFSAVSGIEYRHKGLQVNPIFSFDSGVPFGVGQTAIGYINDVLSQIPTGNLGVATPYAGPGLPNQPYNATCYVDPAFPGSYYDPRDFACRGYSEPALAGQAFTKPRLYTDLNLQYNFKVTTLGVYVSNVFNNYRAEPTINNDWQPLATGYGGVQTGEYPGGNPLNADGSVNTFYYQGARDESAYDQYWLPYQELYQPGRTWRVYMQFDL